MTLRLCGIEGSTVDGLYVAYCNNNVIFDPPAGKFTFFPGLLADQTAGVSYSRWLSWEGFSVLLKDTSAGWMLAG